MVYLPRSEKYEPLQAISAKSTSEHASRAVGLETRRHNHVALTTTIQVTRSHSTAEIITIIVLVLIGFLALLIWLYWAILSKKIRLDEKKAKNRAKRKEKTLSTFFYQDGHQQSVTPPMKEETDTLHEGNTSVVFVPEQRYLNRDAELFDIARGEIPIAPPTAIISDNLLTVDDADYETIPRIDSFKGLPPLQLPPPIIVLSSSSHETISQILVSPREFEKDSDSQESEVAMSKRSSYPAKDVGGARTSSSDTLLPGQSLLLDISSFPAPPKQAWLDSKTIMPEGSALTRSSSEFSVSSERTAVAIETPTPITASSNYETKSAQNQETSSDSAQKSVEVTSFEGPAETDDYVIKFDPEAALVDDGYCEIPNLLEGDTVPISAAKLNKLESQPTFIAFPVNVEEKKSKDSRHTRGKISVDLLGIKARADKRIEMKKQEMRVFLEECSKLDVRPFLDERHRAMMTLERW